MVPGHLRTVCIWVTVTLPEPSVSEFEVNSLSMQSSSALLEVPPDTVPKLLADTDPEALLDCFPAAPLDALPSIETDLDAKLEAPVPRDLVG